MLVLLLPDRQPNTGKNLSDDLRQTILTHSKGTGFELQSVRAVSTCWQQIEDEAVATSALLTGFFPTKSHWVEAMHDHVAPTVNSEP